MLPTGSYHGNVDPTFPNFPSITMETDIGHTIEMLLFDAAIQLDENDDRRIFLESTCAYDPGRLARLTELLRYHDESESDYAMLLDARDHILAEIALEITLCPGTEGSGQ